MRLLVGVSGGIAAYKACELVSLALKRGHEPRVVMTAAAARFVAPLTFAGLTGRRPLVGDEHLDPERAMAHIDEAKWAEVAVVAPMTANTLARLALGLADDALSTVLMALPRGRPVVLCPAMNTEMWLHPVVQRNRRWLDELDGRYRWVEPLSKRLACGDVGPGALADPAEILAACEQAHGNGEAG
jgi:phosphopantothenoylcysteine decarboxylase / phosphopantothenate---cysteine ligase